MKQERPYWNMEIEPLLNTPEIRKIQLERLRKMLPRLYAAAPFYKKMFDAHGLDPDRVDSFEEYIDKIPLFNKQSLIDLVLEKEIAEAMSKRIKINPRILWAEPGSLERSHYKGKVFEKLYETQ